MKTFGIFCAVGVKEFFIILINVPLDAMIFAKARSGNLANFFVAREIYLCIGRLIMLFILLLLGNNLEYSFLIASLFYLYFLVL